MSVTREFSHRLGPITFWAALIIAVPAGAQAQQNWFDQGRALLGTLGGTEEQSSSAAMSDLSADQISAGLREALRVGAERVVDRLGTTNGFNGNADVHIPLPDSLQMVDQALQRVGMGAIGNNLELRLNRAAEAAVPQARALFIDAIAKMSLQDVRDIYNGPSDSATRYFEARMAQPLADGMRPIVDTQLAQVGAVQLYDQMMGEYRNIPFVPDVKANLTNHVLGRAVDGVFLLLAREEAAIREDPARRTTELLQTVFGSGTGG